jgi:hypothetical protein
MTFHKRSIPVNASVLSIGNSEPGWITLPQTGLLRVPSDGLEPSTPPPMATVEPAHSRDLPGSSAECGDSCFRADDVEPSLLPGEGIARRGGAL